MDSAAVILELGLYEQPWVRWTTRKGKWSLFHLLELGYIVSDYTRCGMEIPTRVKHTVGKLPAHDESIANRRCKQCMKVYKAKPNPEESDEGNY